MRILVLILALLLNAKAFSQVKTDELQNSSDPTYGYTALNPLKARKGTPMKSISYAEEFLSGLQTLDGQNLKLIARFSVKDPSYENPKVKLTNRYSGMPLNGKLALLDNYTFVTTGSQDTIQVYVDIYNKGSLMIPMGLKYIK